MNKFEVRLGSIVQQGSGIPFQVQEKDIRNSFFWSGIGVSVKPISLTEDWLKALGFEKEDKVGLILFSKGKISAYVTDKGFDIQVMSGDGGDNITIEGRDWSVHQLQNLYSIMNCEELTEILPTTASRIKEMADEIAASKSDQ